MIKKPGTLQAGRAVVVGFRRGRNGARAIPKLGPNPKPRYRAPQNGIYSPIRCSTSAGQRLAIGVDAPALSLERQRRHIDTIGTMRGGLVSGRPALAANVEKGSRECGEGLPRVWGRAAGVPVGSAHHDHVVRRLQGEAAVYGDYGAGDAAAAAGLTFKGKPSKRRSPLCCGKRAVFGARKLASNFQTANSRSRLGPMQECSPFCRQFFTHLQIPRASASFA